MTDGQPPTSADLHADARGHFISTMHFELGPEHDAWHAQGAVLIDPYLQADGLPWPSASTLLTLADILVGRLASHHTSPRISVTSDLGIRLFTPPVGERLEFRARLLKVEDDVGRRYLHLLGAIRRIGGNRPRGTSSPRPDPWM